MSFVRVELKVLSYQVSEVTLNQDGNHILSTCPDQLKGSLSARSTSGSTSPVVLIIVFPVWICIMRISF